MEIYGGFMVMMCIVGILIVVVCLIILFVIFTIKAKQDHILEQIVKINKRLPAIEDLNILDLSKPKHTSPKIDKTLGSNNVARLTKQCPLCMEHIDAQASRCPHCGKDISILNGIATIARGLFLLGVAIIIFIISFRSCS